MKHIATSVFLSLLINIGYGQINAPTSIPQKEVPKAIIKKFTDKRADATDAKWFPYPNEYGNDHGVAPSYFPTNWTASSREYFEVRYSDKNGSVREVYDKWGAWQLTSRPVQGDLPQPIISQLSEKGYDSWTKINQELVSRVGQKGKFYKVWFTLKKKKRIVFFNESFEHVKTLKWDNDINFESSEASKLKLAPGVKRARKPVEPTTVPVVVRNNAKMNHAEIDVIEWYATARIYDPFGSGFSYYDISIPAFYQLIFTTKSGKYVASYSTIGELLEVAQIITTADLPQAIKKLIQAEEYKSWTWELEHDKIEIDKEVIYRLYAADNNGPTFFLVNSKGVRIQND